MDEWKALDLSLQSAKSIRPKNGWVPDEVTAIRIGEAVAIAQWGETQIAKERPFKARLRNDMWTVHGTLHPQGVFGGTAVIQLNKSNGAVLLALHQYTNKRIVADIWRFWKTGPTGRRRRADGRESRLQLLACSGTGWL